VDVHDKLDDLTALVESARSMPMSASCIVNRGEVLELLDELRAELPEEFDEAERILRERADVIDQARVEAEEIIAAAHEERMRLVSQTEVYAQAQREAGRIRGEAREEAGQMQDDTDAYVDGKLASFEIALTKTLEAVRHGRDRIQVRREEDERDAPVVDDRPLPGA
jgi:cell division septum initiation protein DivIVA